MTAAASSNDRRNPLADDLDHVLDALTPLWDDLRGARLFLTGGTGFFGAWLVESLLWAEDRKKLGVSAVLLTRSAAAFRARQPRLAAHPAVSFLEGDVRDLQKLVPKQGAGAFTHVIHAATDASASLLSADPALMFETNLAGTAAALAFARAAGARKFLLTSSGAVYGRQPSDLTHVPEDHPGAPSPNDPASAYGEGKRVAELLCAIAHKNDGLCATVARCFAFVGPHLPLDSHFAVGNFVRDGLAGGPIKVGGDGTPYRSYMYAADLAVWLWTILLRGEPSRPYNVGSEEDFPISEMAERVARFFGTEWSLGRPPTPGAPPARYVPETARAREELGLAAPLPFDEALRRTVNWHRAAQGKG